MLKLWSGKICKSENMPKFQSHSLFLLEQCHVQGFATLAAAAAELPRGRKLVCKCFASANPLAKLFRTVSLGLARGHNNKCGMGHKVTTVRTGHTAIPMLFVNAPISLGCIACYCFYFFISFYYLFFSSMVWTVGLIKINDWLVDWYTIRDGTIWWAVLTCTQKLTETSFYRT